MEDLNKLRLPLSSSAHLPDAFSQLHHLCARTLHNMLKDAQAELPKEASRIRLFCTHSRPHLDEYLAMFLFRACLPEKQWDLPLVETILNSATYDAQVCTDWEKACVFGLGAVQTGGATPVLVFDEHVQTGAAQGSTSSVALVCKTLFCHRRLPQAVFILCREVDLVDSCGGAHPKHLSTYLSRLHDFADSCIQPKLSSLDKKILCEAAITCLLRAIEQRIAYWKPEFWREPALSSLKNITRTSPLRNQNGFEQAILSLQRNLDGFRQPSFLGSLTKDSVLCFNSQGKRIQQNLLMPFLAALFPLVWGEEIGQACMNIFWNTRLLAQMRYLTVLQTLEENLGAEPEDGTVDTNIGRITFRHSSQQSGNAAMSPWIIDITPAQGVGSVRQALIGYLRKYHMDSGYTIIRNPDSGTLVLSRGHGIPENQWEALTSWLVDWEGSSDTEGSPGCWHLVKSATGKHADFILNGNAAHRYVPQTKLTCDILADWILRHPV